MTTIRTESMEEAKGYEEEHVGEAKGKDKLSGEEHTERKAEERLRINIRIHINTQTAVQS